MAAPAPVVLVQEDFEQAQVGSLPAPYVTVAQQGNWGIAVTDAQSFDGHHSLMVSHGETPGFGIDALVNIPGSLLPLSSATISLRRRVEHAPAGGPNIKLSPFFGNCGLAWSGNGDLVVRSDSGTGQWDSVVGSWSPGIWGLYRLDFDFMNRRMTVTINGADAGSYPLAAQVCSVLDVFTEGTDQNTIYYEDDVYIAVTSTPEPATLAMLVIGGLAVIRKRHR
jgi:hypothetical protein